MVTLHCQHFLTISQRKKQMMVCLNLHNHRKKSNVYPYMESRFYWYIQMSNECLHKKDKQYILLNRACERLFPESKCPLTLVYSEQIRVIENSVVSSKKNIKSCNWKTIQNIQFWIYSHLFVATFTSMPHVDITNTLS